MERAKAGAYLVVTTVVDPGFEAEFNAWYDEEHFPERMALPGFLNGHRMVADRSDEEGTRYLAVYELVDENVLKSPDYLAVGAVERWSDRTRAVAERLHVIDRQVYRDITPTVRDTSSPGATS